MRILPSGRVESLSGRSFPTCVRGCRRHTSHSEESTIAGEEQLVGPRQSGELIHNAA